MTVTGLSNMRGSTKTIAIAAVAAAVALTAVVGPATAARQVNPPAWFICNSILDDLDQSATDLGER